MAKHTPGPWTCDSIVIIAPDGGSIGEMSPGFPGMPRDEAEGPKHGSFMSGNATCPKWAENIFGAWDEPPDYGETVRALYEREDAAF